MIQKELESVPYLKEQCKIIWNHYLSRKLHNEFEPNWVHDPYRLIQNFLEDKDFTEEDSFFLREVVKSHLQKDGSEVPVKTGFPNEGIRLMHDCWKAGSFTWVFMGRIFCEDIFFHRDHVIINRKLPDDIYSLTDKSAPQTLFASYKIDKNVCVGPAISLDQLINHLDN